MARSQVQQLFKASLESHDTVDESALAGGIESMEAAMLSVEEERQEMDAANSDVDEMVEIAEGLESIVASVEATQEEGGLDAQGAQMMQLAVGAYTRRLGLEATDVTPALESFGGDSGRLSATTVSVEEIGKTVRNIWNAIKQAIQRAIKATADFFAKIFGGVDKVISRIDAMEKKVKDLKGSASGKMKVSGAQFLHVGGKVEAGDIVSGLKELDSVANMAYGDYLKAAQDYYKSVADKFKASEPKTKARLTKLPKKPTRLPNRLARSFLPGRPKSSPVARSSKPKTPRPSLLWQTVPRPPKVLRKSACPALPSSRKCSSSPRPSPSASRVPRTTRSASPLRVKTP